MSTVLTLNQYNDKCSDKNFKYIGYSKQNMHPPSTLY